MPGYGLMFCGMFIPHPPEDAQERHDQKECAGTYFSLLFSLWILRSIYDIIFILQDSNLIILHHEITYHSTEYAEVGTYLLLIEVLT
jgi:hypothetical protein